MKPLRLTIVAICALGAALGMPAPTTAQVIFDETQIVDIRISGTSDAARSLGTGTGTLSDGSSYSFQDWYNGDFADLRFTMLSPVNDNLGIFWGFGTGERGQKYEIDPSLKLGVLARLPVGNRSNLTLSATTVLGGNLREGTCTADYGSLGSATVNCRMAGSTLSPSDTLDFLVDEPPADRIELSLRYRFAF